MNEQWKQLIYPLVPKELNRFEVSDFGRLRNINTMRIYKPSILSSGYYSVRVALGGRKKKIHIIIHKAVAYTFIPNPLNLPEVNHKDGVKTNNEASNLEWCTSSYNQQHKYDTGLLDASILSGENNHSAKLTLKDVQYIRDVCIRGSREFGVRALAKQFSVSKNAISAVISGRTWRSNSK